MHTIFVVLAALLVSACSIKRSADNVERNTNEMKDGMNEMRESTRKLREESQHLSKRTDDLEQELTFKESSDMMIQNLRRLFGEDDLPKTSDPQPNREPDYPFYAGVVMKSMWFQFWKGDYREDMAYLDERFELGAEILFVRAMAHTPHAREVNVMNPDRSWKSVAALGAKLEFLRPEYERVAQAAGVPVVSFYDLVVMALKVRAELNPQVPFPRAVAKVNEFAQVAEYMLQLRHNFLPVMVLSSMTDFKDLGTLRRAWKGYVTGLRADLEDYTPAQLREWTRWLNLAVQTRADLRSAGIQPEYNRTLLTMLGALNFGQAELLAAKDEATGIEKLRREFAAAYVRAIEKD